MDVWTPGDKALDRRLPGTQLENALFFGATIRSPKLHTQFKQATLAVSGVTSNGRNVCILLLSASQHESASKKEPEGVSSNFSNSNFSMQVLNGPLSRRPKTQMSGSMSFISIFSPAELSSGLASVFEWSVVEI